MQKKNLIILSHYYPPLNEVASLRLFSFAKYLQHDFNVTIVTSAKYSMDGKTNLLLKDPGITVYEIDYLPAILKGPMFQKLIARFNVLQLRFGGLFDFRLLWSQKAKRFMHRNIELHAGDIVLSSYGPTASFYAGYGFCSKNENIHFVMDYRDMWNGNPYINVLFPFNKIQRSIEKKFLNLASMVLTVSDGLRTELKQNFGVETKVIPNGYFPEEVHKQTGTKNNKKFMFVYSGFLYKGKRDPEPFFKAIRNLLDQNVFSEENIAIRFYASHEGLLRNLMEAYRLQSVVEIFDKVGREEILNIQRTADCLLFFEWNDPRARGVLTGKLFEYLVSGSIILSVGPPESAESSLLIAESNAGYSCGVDVLKIEKAVKEMFQFRHMPEVNMEVIERYNRREIALQLGNYLKNLQAKKVN